VRAVHVLLAADADWVINEVVAALGDAETSFSIVRSGFDVTDAVKQRTPDVAVLDLQIGNMGGMAVTMQLRLDESAGALPHVPVLMLLDRRADVNLARRSAADGWLIKPLDPLRLRRAAKAVAAGGTYVEGAPVPPPTAVPAAIAEAVAETDAADASQETPAETVDAG
jgi:two-component system nitrate/nitrite response regulator NarL